MKMKISSYFPFLTTKESCEQWIPDLWEDWSMLPEIIWSWCLEVQPRTTSTLELLEGSFCLPMSPGWNIMTIKVSIALYL
jgi:hypothetical protein